MRQFAFMKRWWRVLIPRPMKWEGSFKRRRRPSVCLSLCLSPFASACGRLSKLARKLPKNQYFSEILIKFCMLRQIATIATRKPCCRKETARCCKCSFRSKFANNIPYKYKTSHASKATLHSSKHAGAKHNLTQNRDSKSIKVTCLESVEKQWGNK